MENNNESMVGFSSEIKWFLSHQWKEIRRSTFWHKNLALNIILGLLMLIMLLYLLALGFFIDVILSELYPNDDPVKIFNGVLLYYLGFEFLLRFFLQSLPTLTIESYLHLPIRKSSIIHYVLGKSLFVIGNYLSWLVLIPFAVKVIAPSYSVLAALSWTTGMVLLIFSNNFLTLYIKRQMTGNTKVVVLFGLFIISLILLEHFGVVSITKISAYLIQFLLTSPLFILVPAGICFLLYFVNFNYLKAHLYPEEVGASNKGTETDRLGNLSYLKSLGFIGHVVSLDLRLIWRHKRTRSIVFLAPIFLGYGFFFYPQSIYNEAYTFLIFVGIFISGGLMVNYLNYCFSYESNYFDNILANYKDFTAYIKSKYLFGVMISTVCYVLTIPYAFFGTHIFFINTMAFLYNIGFLSFILLYLATFSYKRMDLSKNAAFNYQGLGATHWLAMLPAFLLPVLIYLPFELTDFPHAGLWFIGALGVSGLILHRFLLKVIYTKFMKQKYKMAQGFRE